MPVYQYSCEDCGVFDRTRPVEEASAPTHCPDCGLKARKVFPLVHLRAMQPANRTAWERNERSAHAPHVCQSGCSHGPSLPRPKRTSDKPVLEYSKKRHSRPWMLGH